MATEQQELELRVTLDDQASAQLQQIRQAIGEVGAAAGAGGGPGMQGLNAFDQALGRLSRHALGVGREATELAKIIGPWPVAFATLAYQFQRTSEAAKPYGEQLRQLGNQARMAGVGLADFKSILDQMRGSGIKPGEAGSMIGGFTQAYSELMRVGSQRRTELINMAGPQFARNMLDAISKMGKLQTEAQKLNFARQLGENVYRNELARSGDEMIAAQRRYEFMTMLNVPGLIKLRHDLADVDKDTRDNMDWVAKKYEAIQDAQEELLTTRGKIGDNLKTQFIPVETAFLDKEIDILQALAGISNRLATSARTGAPSPNWPEGPVIPTPGLEGIPGLQHGGIVTGPTLGMLGEHGPEAVIPLDQLGGAGNAAKQNTDDNTGQLERLSQNVQYILNHPESLLSILQVKEYQHGGGTTTRRTALVGERGREAVVGGGNTGVRVFDKPTVGTLTPGDNVVPLNNSSGIPNELEAYTKALVGAGAGPTDVKEWLTTRGVNLNIADCAQYVTRLVGDRGGALPAGDLMAASTWNYQGQPGYANDPYAMNWAVRQNIKGSPEPGQGQGGSHITEPVPQFDANGNVIGWIGRGVNQAMPDIARQQITEKPISIGTGPNQFAIRHEYPMGMQSLVATPEMTGAGTGYKNPMFAGMDISSKIPMPDTSLADQSIRIPPAAPTAGPADPMAGGGGSSGGGGATGIFARGKEMVQGIIDEAKKRREDIIATQGTQTKPSTFPERPPTSMLGLLGQTGLFTGFGPSAKKYDPNEPVTYPKGGLLENQLREQYEGRKLTDRMFGQQSGQPIKINIEHENAPPGVSVETNGGVFGEGETTTSRIVPPPDNEDLHPHSAFHDAARYVSSLAHKLNPNIDRPSSDEGTSVGGVRD